MLHAVTPRTRSRVDPSTYGDPVTGMPSLAEKFSGADLSLTSTGLATLRFGRIKRGLLEGVAQSGRNKGKPTNGTPDSLRGVARLEWLEDHLHSAVSDCPPELLAIEGYSYGSKSNHHSIGEWGGVARLALRRMGIPLILFSPNSVKKFISGNHQAPKTEVVLSLLKRYGVDEPQDDKADACVLAIMAACIARPGIIPLTKFQQEALGGVEEI